MFFFNMPSSDGASGLRDNYSLVEEFMRTKLLSPRIVLLIEDDETFRSVIKMALEEAGCRVYEASDGVEGIELFDELKDQISGVMLDYQMPRLNGLEVFRHIRAKTKTLPVMFVTGYGDHPDLQEVPKIGVSMIAEKPISVEEIEMFVQAITE